MKRTEFVKTCGVGCLGLVALGPVLQSCSGAKFITAHIEGDQMLVPIKAFEKIKNEEINYHLYVISQNPRLQYPICIYRFGPDNYLALLMRCTHQGTELQVFGNKLQCPAHGSEFDNNGNVTNGPASDDLRSFELSIVQDQLRISLT